MSLDVRAFRHSPIIFDFDGVIVDSEVLAARIYAEYLALYGIPITEAEVAAQFTGMRLIDSQKALEARHGIKFPLEFSDGLHAHGRTVFSRHLRAVRGAGSFIRKCGDRTIAIASSSTLEHIGHSLELVGLHDAFVGRCFSAAMLERGKPHPDIYLLAAEALKVPASTCIAIEDSERGVAAAIAAGMYTIGLTAASHCHDGTAPALRAAGAHFIAASYGEVEHHLDPHGS